MQTHEEKKARMRAYYHKNKHKWRTYAEEASKLLSDEEKAARNVKQQQYSRSHYKKNREKVIARTSKYQQVNRDKWAAYQAEWHQLNKPAILARIRKHYHQVVKPRQQKAKASSDVVTTSEAANILGAKLRTFREWVYSGRIPSVKTSTGRYLLRRADVEEILANMEHIPMKIRSALGLSKRKGSGR
jgi:excisionase family DNA binding protein